MNPIIIVLAVLGAAAVAFILIGLGTFACIKFKDSALGRALSAEKKVRQARDLIQDWEADDDSVVAIEALNRLRGALGLDPIIEAKEIGKLTDEEEPDA